MEYNLEAKKSLGQNFLKNTTIIKKIVEEAHQYIDENTNIIEIGPGTGELTAEILKIFPKNKLICIETDDRAIPLLNERFENNLKTLKNLELIHQDIRLFDIDDKKQSKIAENYIIIANIPYYLTGFIFKKFLEAKNQPKTMIFMVQKEIADRAMDKKMSLFSLGVKTYGEPYVFMKVSRGNFVPAPKVDSAVLVIKNINKSIFKNEKDNIKDIEKKYWETAKKAFNGKRKQLGSTLKVGEEKYKKERPENITPSDWIYITKLLYNNTNE
jgi:16S rRNA (adenine1518-N6/adenine1519-N6)-dimethyltransferase